MEYVNGLVQVDTANSNAIVGRHPYWQDVARAYISYLKIEYCNCPHIIKDQKEIIGRAWRKAEEAGGRLEFRVE